MLQPEELSKEECRECLADVQAILYLDIFPDRPDLWNPDKEWDADVLQALAEALDAYGLVPHGVTKGGIGV